MTSHSNITRHDTMQIVQKSWGYEEWVANSPLYCGKKLVIEPEKSSSLHFHVNKTEHIYVASGCLSIEIIEDKTRQIYRLDKGDNILIVPGMVHRLSNLDTENLELFEFSTEHKDSDSYRIE